MHVVSIVFFLTLPLVVQRSSYRLFFFLFCSGHPTAYCAAVTLPLVFLWLFLSVFFGIVVFCLCLFFGYNGLSATITQVGSAAVAAGPSLAAWGNG